MKKRITQKEIEAIRNIRNSLEYAGQVPSVRKLMISMGYKSPRSAAVIINQLVKKGILIKKQNGKYSLNYDEDQNKINAQTIKVPLIGNVSCGTPIWAEENIEAYYPVSTKFAKPPFNYFLLRAHGDSMNLKGIEDNDIVLIRQQDFANNGENVVALIDDCATIKEYHRTENAIILQPASSNKEHKPTILTQDFLIQGVVVTILPKALNT